MEVPEDFIELAELSRDLTALLLDFQAIEERLRAPRIRSLYRRGRGSYMNCAYLFFRARDVIVAGGILGGLSERLSPRLLFSGDESMLGRGEMKRGKSREVKGERQGKGEEAEEQGRGKRRREA